jgi:iron(III) transport system substrate-binding protein
VVFITKEARHPNAAKLLLEFIMSEEGQLILASSNMVTSVSSNPYVPEYSLDYLKKNVQNLVVVRLGDGIIDELLKEDVRKSFISTWKSWLGLG